MKPSLNRTSRLLQIFAVAAITTVVLALILAVTIGISRRNLAAYKEELKNRGEVLDLAAVRVTAPPDAEQRARAFLTIGAEINPLVKTRKFRHMDIPKESPPGKSTIFHHRDLTVVSGTIPYSWDEAAVEFMPLEPDLEKIREISDQGPFGIHPDYSLGHATLIVGSDEAMNVAFTLIAQSYLHMRNGKTSEAARNISSALRISAMLSGQRMVVAQVIALGLIEITKKATWDLLQSPSIQETDLRMLQEAWGNVRIAEGLIPAMRFERASGLTAFDASVENGLAATSSGGRPPSFASWQEISSAAKMYLWGALFRSSDQLHYIKAYQAPIDAAPANPLVGPWKNSYEGARHHYLKANDAQISRMLSEILLIREDFITQVVATQAQAALTSTAIALRRHQLAFQTLPETLDDLVPQFLPTVPFDPFDGQPLRYRKISDREFLLYSTGTDFEDNGGLATNTSRTKTKDIVWPQPITPAPADSGPDRPRE